MSPKEVQFVSGKEILRGSKTLPVYVECSSTEEDFISFFKTCRGAAEWLLSDHTTRCELPLSEHSVMYNADKYEKSDIYSWDLALNSLNEGRDPQDIIRTLVELYH